MKSVAIFCGSGNAFPTIYEKQAEKLSRHLCKEHIKIYFGGANAGLMKIVADTAIEQKAEIIGIMPKFIGENGIAHTGITKMIWVDTMAERKNLLAEKADAFIALPGGAGTLDECMDMICRNQLNLHNKPIAFLNTRNYYMALKHQLKKMVKDGFMAENLYRKLFFIKNPEKVSLELRQYLSDC